MKREVYRVHNSDGTITVWYSDGTMLSHVVAVDAGEVTGGGAVRGVLDRVNGAGNLIASVGSNVFNPFDSIGKALDPGSEEGKALAYQARKFGIIAVLIVLAVLFVYLIFKD